ncbi:hypothetical protein LLG96_11525 [bacterium]|nr:hypothetical protein [bacterium]
MNRRSASLTGMASGLILTVVFLFSAVIPVAAADWEAALKKCETYKFGDSREALTEVADAVRASTGNAGGRSQLEKAFIRELGNEKATLECKDFVCRQLKIIGTKESVPALAKLLTVKETSDMARYALQTNPAPEASNALRDGLKTAEGAALIGIINSLGERDDRQSVDAIGKLVFYSDRKFEDKDKEKEAKQVALAAIHALSKIGDGKSQETLARARQTTDPDVNRAATQGLLLWADTFGAKK